MFIRYLKHNCMIHPIQYILLISAIVFMLVISIIANGIMMGSIADDLAWVESRYCGVRFNEKVTMAEIRGDFLEFIEKCPEELRYISLYGGSGEQPDIYVVYYPNYGELEAYYEGLSLDYFTEEQYLNHEKVAGVGTGTSIWGMPPHTFADEEHIIVEGEVYRIKYVNPMVPTVTLLWGSEPENFQVKAVDIYLKKIPTRSRMEEVNQLMLDVILKNRGLRYGDYMTDEGLLATRKSAANIVMSAFVQLIAAFNALLLFKYMLDERRKYFAVMRLCGFGKFACIGYSFGELIIVSGISAALACAVVALLRPILARHIEMFTIMFDVWHTAAFALGFAAAAALVFAVYILPSLGKSVTQELKEM